MRIFLIAFLGLMVQPAYAVEHELHFWPGVNASQDKRLVAIHDGPCGAVASARVKSIPAYSKKASLVPERVFELDTGSRVIRSWNIPVEAVPTAVHGKILYFSFIGTDYTVTPDGKLEKQTKASMGKSGTSIACKLPKAFEGSAYAGCWLFEDTHSGRKRVLAFEGVCT